MDVRGERECKNCGMQWSYYETGNISCPECGSMRSVGIDERKHHTASARDLDLTHVTGMVDDEPIQGVARAAADEARDYIATAGFVAAGELRPLSDHYLAVRELVHVGSVIERQLQSTEDEQLYFLSVLRAADTDDRPIPDAVPQSLAASRGLAYADAVDEYRSELTELVDPDPELSRLLEQLREHVKRVHALDGDVPPEQAETLVMVARDLETYVSENKEAALATAADRLKRLG